MSEIIKSAKSQHRKISITLNLNPIHNLLTKLEPISNGISETFQSVYQFTDEWNMTCIPTKILWFGTALTMFLVLLGAMIISQFDPPRKYQFKKVEDSACSSGWGYLMEDTFDIETTRGAMDITEFGKRVRGSGEGAWRQKTVFGSMAVQKGCNIWDLHIQYDEKRHSEETSIVQFPGAELMIGIIDQEWIGMNIEEKELFPGAADKEIKSLAVFTADGVPFNTGDWGNTTGTFPMVVAKSGSKIRVILDMDKGKLLFRWKWGVLDNPILEGVDRDSKWKLMILAKNQESISLEY